jgi:predicted thioesterase
MDLELGLQATVTATVGQADTARALGSGDVDVLGTPRVLALAEQAAVAVVAGALPAEQTSVGTWVELDHAAPTRVGAEVSATARLAAVDGRRLLFEITVDEGDQTVARVQHRRAVVDRSRFA